MDSINTVRQDENTRMTKKSETLIRLLKYLLNYRGLIVAVLFTMAVSIAITLINPLLAERAINVHIKDGNMRSLVSLSVLAIILNVALALFTRLRMYLMALMSNDVLIKIRLQLYEHLQKLGLKFFDSRPAGKIIARVMGDVNSLKGVLSDTVTTLLPQFLTLAAVMFIMFSKNAILATACLISFPLLTFGLLYIQNRCRELWHVHRKKSSNLSGFIHEDIAGIRVIQSFAAEDETNATLDVMNRENHDTFKYAVRINDAFGPVIEFCSGVATICLYYAGVKLSGTEPAPVGTLLAFVTYASMVWNPIMQLGNLYNQFVRNIAGAERIFEILDTEPEIIDAKDAKELPEIRGEVEFRNVSFSYDNVKEVLENVSFKVRPGETIALVGPTGAGKSTIANLVCRFYDVQKGEVLIDGMNISSVTIASLRAQMGVMTQDNFLFTGTIKENIRYGKLDATDEEIEAAAKAVHAHEFIMKMKDGYDTELSERGAGLSAGEKQLIAFARTMVSSPKILILDEATSSIDTQTEILVQQGIGELLKGRTSFVIAHRLSTIRNADRIFVVNNGGIAESGTHDELMQKKGEYYELYTAQM
jgi:ATP-binding cassette subfamily B protein